MQPVIDEQGTLVAWLNNSTEVFTPEGVAVGSVQVGFGLFSLDGDFLGYYRRGLFRGQDGFVVAELGPSDFPATPPDHPVFASRKPASTWPPIVPFEDEWSPHWRRVLAVPAAAGSLPTGSA